MKKTFTLLLACALPLVSHADYSWKRVLSWARMNGVPVVASEITVDSQGGVVSGWRSEWGRLPTETDMAGITEAQATAEYDAQAYPAPDVTLPLVRGTNVIGKARPVVDADTMETINLVDTASPQTTMPKQWAQAASNRAERASIVTALKALKETATNTIAQAQASVTTAQAIAPTAWTGTQRTEAQKIRAAIIDADRNTLQVARDYNDLRKLLLRYFKEAE
jgi:hypothetical protein